MIYISPWLRDSEGAGNWTLQINADDARNGVFYNANNSDGDNISYKVYMPAGTYTLKILASMGATYGIMKVKIDGVVVATWDQYNDPLIHNQINTTTDISVATSGVKTIQCIVDGQNGSSSGYYIALQEMAFYRTA